METTAPRAYRFGDFTLDLQAHRLARRGRDIPLQAKMFETLRCLMERHGRLVTKRELHDHVWGDVAVSDGALGRCIVGVHDILRLRREIVRDATSAIHIALTSHESRRLGARTRRESIRCDPRWW